MKKIAAALLLSTTVAAPAFADGEKFYAGVTLGRSHTSSPISNIALTKANDTAVGVLAGYQFTKNWGAEVFYINAGKFSGQNAAGTVTATGKADTFGLVAVGTLPLSNILSVYGKLGVASTKTSVSTSVASTFSGATRTAATYGLGGIYDVTPTIGIRFGWDRIGGATDGGTGTVGVKDHFNADIYSLGAVFKF